MSWLSDLLGKIIKHDSTILPDRKTLRFLGNGFVVSDNPDEGSTDVTIEGDFSLGSSGFDSWEDFYESASALNVPITVYIDENVTVPEGSYDVSRWTFIGLATASAQRPTLSFDPGATFTANGTTFQNVALIGGGVVSVSTGLALINLIDVEISGSNPDGFFVLSGDGSIVLVCDGSFNALQNWTGQTVTASGGFILVADGSITVAAGAFQGSTGALTIAFDDVFKTFATQSSFSGSVTIVVPQAFQDMDLGGHKIMSLGTPSTPGDAAPVELIGSPFPYGFPSAGTLRRFSIREDFWINTYVGRFGVATGTGANAGAIAPTLASNGDGRVGAVEYNTGTDTTGVSGLRTHTSAFRLGDGTLRLRYDIWVPTASDGSQTFSVVCGALDALSPTPSDGVFFRYQHTENSGRWTAVCRSNSVETGSAVDTGVAAAGGTAWQALEIDVNAAATEARFHIDGVLVATITSNIPSGVGRDTGEGAAIIKSAGTTGRAFRLDKAYLDYESTVPQ